MTGNQHCLYCLSNAFDLISESKFRLIINRSEYLEIKMGQPSVSVGESILLIHAQRTTAHCQLRRGNCQ